MSKKGIIMRSVKLMTVLSIFKGTVNNNENR